MGYVFVSYFLTGRCLVLKLSEYSFHVRSQLQKKFHGDLEHLQICHATFKGIVLQCFHFVKCDMHSPTCYQCL